MNDDDLILIEKYLRNELNDAEMASVETRAAEDTNFAQEISLQKDMLDGIERHFDDNIKSLLAATENHLRQETKVVQPNFWLSRGLPLAAAIITFIMVGYLLIKEKPSSQELYVAYYETYPNIVAPLDRSNSGVSVTALSFYENGDFEKARALLEQEIVAAPDDIGLQFYFGICQLELDNPDFAIAELKPIADAKHEIFGEPAGWYVALAHLKAGSVEEAKKLLVSIKNNKQNAYSKRATALLDELD